MSVTGVLVYPTLVATATNPGLSIVVITTGLLTLGAVGIVNVVQRVIRGSRQDNLNRNTAQQDTSNRGRTQQNTSNSGTTQRNSSETNSKSNKSGGTKRRKTNRHDDDSSSTIHPSGSPTHNVARHIVTRLKRWFRFVGILQRITIDTRLKFKEIILGEASAYQDRHSGLGRSIHAAHVVRAGTVNSILQTENRTHYQGLVDFLAHTQNVPMEANVFHGVGGRIDRFQTNLTNLYVLNTINFNPDEPSWDDDAMGTINVLIIDFRNLLVNSMAELPHGEMKNQINEAIRLINDMDSETFFNAGVKGYLADYEAWKR